MNLLKTIPLISVSIASLLNACNPGGTAYLSIGTNDELPAINGKAIKAGTL